jgi:hypothetical protein
MTVPATLGDTSWEHERIPLDFAVVDSPRPGGNGTVFVTGRSGAISSHGSSSTNLGGIARDLRLSPSLVVGMVAG